MSDNVVEMRPKAQGFEMPPLAQAKALSPMIRFMEFRGMGKNTTALIDSVVQTNLQAMQELLRAENPEATPPLAEGNAVSPMMWSMEFAGIGKSTTAIIDAVVQTSLLAMQELLRAENPEAVLEVQQRFAFDYLTVLMRSTMALVDAIKSAAAGEPPPFPR